MTSDNSDVNEAIIKPLLCYKHLIIIKVLTTVLKNYLN